MRSQKQYLYNATSARQTRKLGELLAKELRGGEILALTGELGSGKTTFARGVLKGLGVKGPYTSPTFVVMKKYKIKKNNQSSTFPSRQRSCRDSSKPSFIQSIYHVDAYRVGAKDILNLGWREIVSDKHNVIIMEWAGKVKRIIPERAIWIEFEHLENDQRKISFNSKFKNQNAK